MAMRTTIDDPDLLEILDGISRGQVALPNFQRDFDWSDSDIRALLATVLNGWPMGSLLLVEGNPENQDFYSPRRFEFAPELDGVPNLIVLDGQQRLTSLYAALYDKSDSVHAVSLTDNLQWGDIDSVDGALRTFKRSVWDRHFPTPKEQFEGGYLPVSALRSSTRFFDWRDAAAQDGAVIRKLTETYREHLSGLYRYRMPALHIARGTHPAAVARIFERVNKTGQQLGAFDLMVAKSFTPEFNLRVKWEQARNFHPELGRFYGADGLAPLQVITLRAHTDVRASKVLTLTPPIIHDLWDSAVEALAKAVRFSFQELGVLSQEYLPYNSLMVVMAAHIWSRDIDQSEVLKMKRWFWASCLTSRYAVGSNTVAQADYKQLGQEGDAFAGSRINLDWTVFRDATKQSAGAIHRAWLCALGASMEQSRQEDAALPTPRSLIPRGTHDKSTAAPPHLLTLSFILASEHPEDLARQFLDRDEIEGTPGPTAASLDKFLRARLDRAAKFIATECQLPVKVVSDLEDDLAGRGD